MPAIQNIDGLYDHMNVFQIRLGVLDHAVKCFEYLLDASMVVDIKNGIVVRQHIISAVFHVDAALQVIRDW